MPPQDRKAKAETVQEPFEFAHNGETFTLPPSSAITSGMLRRYRKLDDLDMTFSIIEELASPEALEALDEMSLDDYNQLISDWQSHIGLTPGKS